VKGRNMKGERKKKEKLRDTAVLAHKIHSLENTTEADII
jgi:hypothetical protein